MPDRFFQSGLNYNEFLKWSAEIRTSLLALNRFGPGNSMEFDPKVLKDYLLNKAQTFAWQLSSESKMDKQDKEIKNIQEHNAHVTELVQQENITQQTAANAAQEQKTEEAKESIIEKNNERDAQIQTEIAGFDYRAIDDNNPIPEEERIDSNTSHRLSEEMGQLYTTADFPQHGQPWDDHVLRITEVLNSRIQFEVVSGYKAPDDKTPADKEFKSWVIVKGNDKTQWESDPTKTWTPERPYSDYANEILEKIEQAQFPGSYKFFIEKLHGRYSNGKPYKLNPIKSQKEVYSGAAGSTNLTNRMVFSAYIDNYNDGYEIESSSYSFLGRAEQVPIYKSTTRNMVLEFTLLSDYSAELMVGMEKLNQQLGRQGKEHEDRVLEQLIKGSGVDWGLGQTTNPRVYNGNRVGGHVPGMYSDTPEGLWSKLTFLAQCCYPYYREDGKMKEQPMIRMRIADFYDVILSPKSMNLQMTALGDSPQVDMNPSSLGNMPLGMKVTINGTIVHNYEPSSNYFGFYHRTEYDKKTLDPINGVDINLQKGKIESSQTKKSPVSALKGFNEKFLDGSGLELKKQINNFKGSFAQLDQPGIRLSDAETKQQTRKAMEAFKAIDDIVNHLRAMQGLDPYVEGEETKKGDYMPNTDSIISNTKTKFDELKNKAITARDDIRDKMGQVKQKIKTPNVIDYIPGDLKNAIKNATPNPTPKTIGDITGDMTYNRKQI